MPGMKRLLLLLSVAALMLAACSSSESEKQWYKPNVNYTTADFERDRVACTDKRKVLDEGCMKQRGWSALSGDITPPVKPPESTKGKY
jgi:PBP1b-binding outer membrane lipoprotein LpoB